MSKKPQVSKAPGVWSVVLAGLASPVGAITMLLLVAFATMPMGGMSDAGVQNAFGVAAWVRGGVVAASVPAAIALGVISISHSSRAPRSVPGRRAALTLGVIGVLTAIFSGTIALFVYLPQS